ncbi:MAG: TonB-dependent receptor [Acidobacteria bacterium]|nr:TonB-dependent receptor [Acidobacteriota bacterium]MCW5970050.1 TonB-dependent receptor [Blastocatellales bacterium]
MKSKPNIRIAVVFSVLLMLPAIASAQTTTASLLGSVRDQSGAVVANATVTAKNTRTGLERKVATDESGRYRISELLPGEYQVQVEQPGFTTGVRDGVVLTVGREVQVDFSLTVGDISEKTIITSGTAYVETTNPTISGLVNQRTIQELPINGRDVFQLTTLQTGVTSSASLTGGGGLGSNPTLVGPGSAKISVNGARITANQFLLDGTTVNDAFNNTPGGLSGSFLGVDALQEFQVITNSYGAEFGQAGGAVVNAVTKSGTNNLHGTAFWFHRNSAFDAKNRFDPVDAPIPGFKRNQFGGTIGGPIVQDKTFFFGSYEGLRQDLGLSRIFTVPTASARARAVPSVRPYIDLYPQPNGRQLNADTAQYVRPAKDITGEDQFMIRGDHTFSANNRFAARYTFSDSDYVFASGPIQNTLTIARNQYATLSDTHVFSQKLVNVARFGFNRSFIEGTEPFVVSVPTSLSFIPGHPMGGFFGLADVSPLANSLQVPRKFTYNVFEFSDQVTWTQGGHTIKFGGLIRRMQFNSLQGRAEDGVFIFQNLNAFLNAQPQAFVAPRPGSSFYRGIRQTIFAPYIQNDWRVRPNLTINLGLRYETHSTPTEVNGLLANLRRPTDAAPTIGPPFMQNPSRKNFAPRVGFAWQPFDSKTSIRGGFGVFDVVLLPYNYRSEITLQPPFSVTAQVAPAPFPNAFDLINNDVSLPEFNAFSFETNRPYVMQYNLSVQREVGWDTVVSLAYVGSRGVHLTRRNNINLRTDVIIGPDGSRSFPVIATNQIRPRLLNPRFGQVRLTTMDANSNYNALQFNISKRFSRNFEFTTSYTWAKAIDDAADYTGAIANIPAGAQAQDTYNLRNERGRSNFDIRHNFASGFVYNIPWGAGLTGAAKVIGYGWQFNGFISARTGFPFSPLLGFDRAQDGTQQTGNTVGQRPNLVSGRSFQSIVTGNPDRFFDPAAFTLPAQGTYGNVGRNVLTGPNFVTADLGLTKNTNITEALRFQFRVEVFNFFNKVNFALPDNLVVFSNATGAVPGNSGVITRTANTARQLQLALKFIF